MGICVWLNSTCVGVFSFSPNVCTMLVVVCTYTRECVYITRMHSQHAGVRRLVTCTCQNQYLASLGYDNAAVCVPRTSPCIHTCIYTYICCARTAHASGTICRISRNFRVALVTRGVNNVRSKTFPISERRSRVTSRVYWTFLNRRRV